METIELLGQIIPAGHKRDAVHIAVAPLQATTMLYPGQLVALDRSDPTKADADMTLKSVGIVDPYLQQPVGAGQWFWCFLLPKTITSLRHEWSHPDFPDVAGLSASVVPPDNRKSKLDEAKRQLAYIERETERQERQGAIKRIMVIANDLDLTYEELMDAAKSWLDHGDYLCDGDKFESAYLAGNFWDDYEKIMNTEVPGDKRANFFSCAC
jgi:hypothetical protein